MIAVLIEKAECVGSGSDTFKRVNGLTKAVRQRIEEVKAQVGGEVAVLARSHTKYLGQRYKLVVPSRFSRFTHRQIADADYEIVRII